MGEVFVTPPAPEGPFTAVGRAIDEFLSGIGDAMVNFARLVAEAEEFAELGRNPYTALAAIEDRVNADADLKFAHARWRLLRDSALDKLPSGEYIVTRYPNHLDATIATVEAPEDSKVIARIPNIPNGPRS